jgi:hypothetical protein
MAYFKLISHNLLGGTEESAKIQTVSGPRFEPETSRI